MKKAYFTPQNIDKKSLEMLENLENIRKIEFFPEKSALLIIDMQKFFLEKSSHAFIESALAIIPKIKKLANAYLKRNLPVISTRHINTEKDAMLMGKWWRDYITANSPMGEIIQNLTFSDAHVIDKTQYDSFYKTDLETFLRKNNVAQIVITGVMTHLCCETTARSAFIRGIEPFFTIDGTATSNEEFHTASLLNLSHGFAIPVLTEKILEKF